MGVVRILYDEAGAGQSKMMASKPEIHIPQLVDMIAKQFPQLFKRTGKSMRLL